MLKMGNVKSWARLTLVAAAVASVVGCSNNDGTPPVITPILAVDGYLAGCAVTVGGSRTAVATTPVGRYDLEGEVGGSDEIVAKGCKDPLTGSTTPTLRASGATVVSPITTMIEALGGGSSATDAKKAEVEQKVRAMLNIPASVVLAGDPVANADLQKAAATVTAILQTVRKSVEAAAAPVSGGTASMTPTQVNTFVDEVFTQLVTKAATESNAATVATTFTSAATFTAAFEKAATTVATNLTGPALEAINSATAKIKTEASSISTVSAVIVTAIASMPTTGVSTQQAIADISEMVKVVVDKPLATLISLDAGALKTEAAKSENQIDASKFVPIVITSPATGTGSVNIGG